MAVASARSLLAARNERPTGALFEDDCDRATGAAAVAVASFAQLGALYPQWLAGPPRKRAGAWFTPRELADPTALRTLQPLASCERPLRIVDPACGGGAFLLAALRARLLAGACAREVVERELFGVDLDPTAAQLAAWTLREACGDNAPAIEAIESHVHAGDGLRAFGDGTFDAVVGNPPWETLQHGHGLAAAKDARGANTPLRAGFQFAGRGKLFTYRLFVERALLLLRSGGRLGLLVPASLYFDRDARPLREHLMTACRWEWMFGFENRRRLFTIDSRYRFCAIVAETGASTTAIRVAFSRTEPSEWAADDPVHLKLAIRDVHLLSPSSGAFVETNCDRDLELLRKITANGTPLLGANGACHWRQGDFNMTSDRAQFLERTTAERNGYVRHPDGTWRRGDADAVLLPLVQGGMLAVLHPNAGAFAGGTGRAVRWRTPSEPLVPEPQYLIARSSSSVEAPARVALRALSNATNERSAIPCLLDSAPCGNSLGVLWPRPETKTPVRDAAFVAGVLASLTFDWALRKRLAGTNLNGFVLADTVLPIATDNDRAEIAEIALRMCAMLPWHGPMLVRAHSEDLLRDRVQPALDQSVRDELRIRLELLVARAFGLGTDDLEWMLRDCDLPVERLQDRQATARLDPKGFWRVDRKLPPHLRLPIRTLIAANSAASRH